MDDAVVCVHCGCPTSAYRMADKKVPGDKTSFGLWIIGFIIPIIGLIVYIVCHNSQPLKAKSAGMGALWGVLLPFALFMILTVFLTIFPLVSMYTYQI